MENVMDEYERRTTHIRTEEVVPTTPVAAVPQPVYQQPIMAATPVVPVEPVVTVPAQPMAGRVVTDREYVTTGPTGIELTRRVIGLAFGILQGLIVLRIILLLLVANRSNDIVQFILGVTTPFVAPFRDMFALDTIGSSGSVLDVAAIVALIGWTLVEMLILAIVNLGARRSRTVVS
jgi:uncharacterized protein YggT (Ycf19 family)